MTIISIIIGIVILPLVIALFIKKEYSVFKSITINKSRSKVFDFLKYLKNHDQFVTWSKIDPNIKKSFTGEDGEVGFISRWESDHKKVGVGEQEILKIEEGKQIDYEMRFYKPFKAKDKSYLKIEEITTNETKVIWGFNGRMKYPMNILLLFMNFEKSIGEEFSKSLGQLKGILDSE